MKTTFFRYLFMSDKPESSKRFFGAIGYITAIIYIGIWNHGLIEELLYVSAAMITAGKVIDVFNKRKGSNEK